MYNQKISDIPVNKLKTLSIIFCSLFYNHYIMAEMELLNKPAIQTMLAEKSILIDIIGLDNGVLAVGERGHIINWQKPGQWQQENVPVSVALTAVTVMPDGTRVAVGHDSAIIVSEAGSNDWNKVFDGYQLLDLKAELFNKQISLLNEKIQKIDDEDEKEELEFQLEDLSFALEDTLTEKKEGPNKPLLSVTATTEGHLFAVGAYGTLLISTDKGSNWTLLDNKIENPEKFHLNSVITSSDDKIYIVGENGIGFVSDDQGNTWTTMQMPYSGSLFGINAQINSSNLIAFGLQGNIMVSNDSGNLWTHKKVNTSASFLGGTISPDGKAYVVGHGGIVVDVDVSNIEQINIRKHPSGAAFSTALIDKNALILVGQFGIISWQLNN